MGLPVDGESAQFVSNVGEPRIAESTVWSVFDETSTYFEPTTAAFMINFRVDDLDGLLAQLAGCDDVWVDPRREEHAYGRFAWVRDPDGNRIELWEPT